MLIHFFLKGRAALPALFLCFCSVVVYAQTDDPVSDAEYYARKFKDDDVMCLSSKRYFTFDKGKNSLNDKVVVIQEDGEYQFLGLRKFAGLMFYEFYNKFIELKSFKRYDRIAGKYIAVDRVGVDRSVTDDDIFFDDSRIKYFPIRFNNKGALVKVNVRKEYNDGRFLTRLFFHSSYPIGEQVFEFKVPDWLTVDFKQMNFEGHKVDVQQQKKGGYTYYTFKMNNIPAYKSEYRRLGAAYTDPHIVLQIRSFKAKGEQINGFDKVDDVYAWNNRMYLMAGNETSSLKPQLAKITQQAKTDEEKIKAIYYWVQDNIRYIAYEDGYSGYIPASAQDVLAKKYGDCKGMANLLTEFLKLAGYDARFSWIGTRQLPYPQSLPALCVNNHAITALYFKGKTYFLDATEDYGPFGEDAYRLQGKEVMVSNGESFEIVPVPDMKAEDSKLQTKASFSLDGIILKGPVTVTLTGNQRTGFHQRYHDLPSTEKEDFLSEYLEFGSSDIQVKQVKTSDLNDRDKTVELKGQVQVGNSVHEINKDYYVSIDFFPKSLERFIPDEKRIEGYDLGESILFDDEISLTIGPDQSFSDLPEPVNINQEGYSFKGEYTVNGNVLSLRKTLHIKNPMIRKSDFANWKQFIHSLRDFNQNLIRVVNK